MPHELGSKPGHLIWRAYQLTWQLFAEEVGELDITPVQEALLLVLSKRTNVDQKTLAEILALDRSTAGDVLDRLEKRELVTRIENDADRRSRLVNLTKSGKLLSQKLRPVALRAAERLLAPLSLAERDEFMRFLRIIVGLADPLEHVATAPPLASKHCGKQILCIGLFGAMGETIIDRLRSEGARVETIFASGIEERTRSVEIEFKNAINRCDGLECVVNGGNLSDAPTNVEDDGYFLRMQGLVNSRWFALQYLLPYFLKRGRGVIINLGLFPPFGSAIGDHVAVATANSAIAALSKQVADEYRESGIVCNALSPSVQVGSRGRRTRWAKVPAIDIAQAVSYLASDEARSVSASNIVLG